MITVADTEARVTETMGFAQVAYGADVSPQLATILLVLADNHPRIVTNETLREAAGIPTYNSFKVVIHHLRRCLGPHASIRVCRGRGYWLEHMEQFDLWRERVNAAGRLPRDRIWSLQCLIDAELRVEPTRSDVRWLLAFIDAPAHRINDSAFSSQSHSHTTIGRLRSRLGEAVTFRRLYGAGWRLTYFSLMDQWRELETTNHT